MNSLNERVDKLIADMGEFLDGLVEHVTFQTQLAAVLSLPPCAIEPAARSALSRELICRLEESPAAIATPSTDDDDSGRLVGLQHVRAWAEEYLMAAVPVWVEILAERTGNREFAELAGRNMTKRQKRTIARLDAYRIPARLLRR